MSRSWCRPHLARCFYTESITAMRMVEIIRYRVCILCHMISMFFVKDCKYREKSSNFWKNCFSYMEKEKESTNCRVI